MSNYNPQIHRRRSIRLKDWDYTWGGWYYVTICAFDRKRIFGNVVNDEMVLNDYGKIAEQEWLRTAEIRNEVELDEFQVMPNHFHGIIIMNDAVGDVGADRVRPNRVRPQTNDIRPRTKLSRKPKSLGSILAGFKSAVTSRIIKLRHDDKVRVWQNNYYEHIIRNEQDLYRIREYIQNNPLKWALDEYYPEHQQQSIYQSGRTPFVPTKP